MVKIKLGVDITFHDEYEIETEDYESLTSIEEIIDYEKTGICEEPMFIVETGKMVVDVKVIK